ncbi:MAG: hypothetical protein JST85_29865 [Acidobacteria bacterium]|nr:hypothetical protein [Acidobacteriota bacterium]
MKLSERKTVPIVFRQRLVILVKDSLAVASADESNTATFDHPDQSTAMMTARLMADAILAAHPPKRPASLPAISVESQKWRRFWPSTNNQSNKSKTSMKR